MAIKTKTFTIISFGLAIACLVFLIISFASDRWVVSTEKEVSGFKNLGLWSACFSRYRPPAWALVDKYYDGCWWVFDRELDDLRHFLFPPWFVGTQVMVTVSLTFQIISVILMIMNAINCFPYSKFKDNIALVLTVTFTLLHAVTAVLLIVAVIMFGARADNERTWLERPDQNYLSWSFGLCVLSAFLAVLSALAAALEFHRLRLSRKGYSGQVVLTNVPPPAPAYVYSNQGFQPTYTEKASEVRSQPGYVNRYSTRETSVRPRPPNSMFAVSGAGEVYFNRSYMNDDNLQRGRANGSLTAYERRQFNQERKFDESGYPEKTDTQQVKAGEPERNNEKLNDYEESKKTKQPVLPEYVPKSKIDQVKKIDIDNTLDESCDGDVKKSKKEKDSGNEKEKRKERSESKSKQSTRSRSDLKKHKKKEQTDTDDDAGHSRHRSKKRGSDDDDDGKEHSRSRSHSKRKTSSSSKRKSSHSRERNSSRHKSKSRDAADSSDSGSLGDSDSVASKSKKKRSSSRKSRKHRSASKERSKKEKNSKYENGSTKKSHDGSFTDISGSEYSSKHTLRKKGNQTTDSKKRSKSLEYSDTESVRSKQRSRSRDNQIESGGRTKTRTRDFSDTESVRSKQSRRGDLKPKGTYSSYYEY